MHHVRRTENGVTTEEHTMSQKEWLDWRSKFVHFLRTHNVKLIDHFRKVDKTSHSTVTTEQFTGIIMDVIKTESKFTIIYSITKITRLQFFACLSSFVINHFYVYIISKTESVRMSIDLMFILDGSESINASGEDIFTKKVLPFVQRVAHGIVDATKKPQFAVYSTLRVLRTRKVCSLVLT
jgi:hypothetical protein